jgi:hypothetical protein
MRLGWSLENQVMVHQLTSQLDEAVEVAVAVETIRIRTVIVGMSMISAVDMALAAMAIIIRIMVEAMEAIVVAVVAMIMVVVAMVVAMAAMGAAVVMVAAPMKLVKYVARLGILR